jgi:hypothetical protein
MAAEKSLAAKGRAETPSADEEAEDGGDAFNHRFWIAQTYGLHFDCPHAACKRHRTCSRPATVPCYGKHLSDLRRHVFPQLRHDIEQMQQERDRRGQPRGGRSPAAPAEPHPPLPPRKRGPRSRA